MFRSPRYAAVVMACVALACSHERSRHSHDDESVSESSDSDVDVTATSADAVRSGATTFTDDPVEGITITTRSGKLRLHLRHDSVLASFSDSLRRSVHRDVDSSMAAERVGDHSGIGGAIEGMVKSTVNATLTEVFDKARGFPVSDLKDVRLDDGAIEFDYRHRQRALKFEGITESSRPFLSQFHPADAARFVGAVRARIRA